MIAFRHGGDAAGGLSMEGARRNGGALRAFGRRPLGWPVRPVENHTLLSVSRSARMLGMLRLAKPSVGGRVPVVFRLIRKARKRYRKRAKEAAARRKPAPRPKVALDEPQLKQLLAAVETYRARIPTPGSQSQSAAAPTAPVRRPWPSCRRCCGRRRPAAAICTRLSRSWRTPSTAARHGRRDGSDS